MESTDEIEEVTSPSQIQSPPFHKANGSSRQAKILEILLVCRSGNASPRLQELATSRDGFVRDDVRREAWSRLLNLPNSNTVSAEWRTRPPHKDEDQVALDVHRSFVYYPVDQTDSQLEQWKNQLHDLITQVLRSYPQLNYFQGYHDIAQVILLVFGQQRAPEALASLSLLRLRDFMLPQMSPSITQLSILPAIISRVDRGLYVHLSGTKPFFALSATLTMYAHEVQEYSDIARLFDFFIALPAVIPIYFFAVIVLSRSTELFEIPKNEPEMLHSVLSKLPKPLDLESLILRTKQTFAQHPPETLGWPWWHVASSSTLKTTLYHQHSKDHTNEYGEKMFVAQVNHQRRLEQWKWTVAALKRYRKPITRMSMALAVAALSYWLASTSHRS